MGRAVYAYANGDPVENVDPLGLFDWPSLPPWLYNSSVGIADTLSMGIGPLLREEYGISGPDTCSSSYEVGQAAGIIGGFVTGEGEEQAAKWTFGAFKSEAKWLSQMESRGWTRDLINEALEKGETFPAVNNVNPANPALRYVSPANGQSVVIDTVTNEVLHIGGPGFLY